LEALLHRLFVWHLKLSLLSIVIPKRITDSEIEIGILLIIKTGTDPFVPRNMTGNFSGFADIIFISNQKKIS